jgi:hypothetical protein
MNTTTMRTMIAAAALVVAAGTASAQTYRAQVPVAFRAGGKLMAAGSYRLDISKGAVGGVMYLRNTDSNTVVTVLAGVKADPPEQWREAGGPKLAFSCAGDSCTLSEMWNGSDTFAYSFPAPKAPAAELAAQRLQVVTLTMIKTH